MFESNSEWSDIAPHWNELIDLKETKRKHTDCSKE